MTPFRRASARMAFVALSIAAILVVAVYVMATSSNSPKGRAAPPALPHEFITAVPAGPLILFRNASAGELFGRLAVLQLPLTEGRLIAPLSCERVHYAAGWGVCMVSDETRMPVRYEAYIFDSRFARGPAIRLSGPPIRARVAPDGRRAVLTVFERGHSYADDAFSTKTIVVDTSSGRPLVDLEQFAIEKDGRSFKAVDFNFWGVTFARDGDHFFATLKTGKERYLVKGSVDARRAAVVRANVECPSLSPDEALLVFKKPLTQGVGWRLHVLELASGAERPLNQVRRSVDDQVDWFDETHVLYHDSAPEGTGIWMLSVDGVSPPHLLVPNAYSPAVQR